MASGPITSWEIHGETVETVSEFTLGGSKITADGETLDWKKHKVESRLPGEISITSDMQMTPPLWQKVKRS